MVLVARSHGCVVNCVQLISPSVPVLVLLYQSGRLLLYSKFNDGDMRKAYFDLPSQWTLSVCLSQLLGLIQVSLQLCCFSLLVILYYKYFPEDLKLLWKQYSSISLDRQIVDPLQNAKEEEQELQESSQDVFGDEQPKNQVNDTTPLLLNDTVVSVQDDVVNGKPQVYSPLWSTSLTALYSILFYAGLVILITLIISWKGSQDDRVGVAGLFGFMSAFTGMLQFVPQIIHTLSARVSFSEWANYQYIEKEAKFLLIREKRRSAH